MILRRRHLIAHPAVSRAMTGLTVPRFEELLNELLPASHAARQVRLDRPDRRGPSAAATASTSTPRTSSS